MKFFKRYPKRAGLKFLFAAIVGGIGAAYGTFCGLGYFFYITDSYFLNINPWSRDLVLKYIYLPIFSLEIIIFGGVFAINMIIFSFTCFMLFGITVKRYLDYRKKYNTKIFILISISLAIVINIFVMLAISFLSSVNFKFPSIDRILFNFLLLAIFTGIFSGGIGGWLFALLAPKPSEKAEAAAIPVSQPENEP
jgi:hypothetical protein